MEQVTNYAAGHDVIVAGLSPDGNRLAYASIDGGLFERDNRTSKVQELDAPAGLSISELLFESDSALLAVGLTNRQFATWTIPLDGSAAKRLLTDTGIVALSHDGKRVAWLNHKDEVWTASLDGTAAHLLLKSNPAEKIGSIFWSANDDSLWFNRLRRCYTGTTPQNGFVFPDSCDESDLASYDAAKGTWRIRANDLRFDSGFFAGDGNFFFLREDVDRKSEASNLWSVQTDKTGNFTGQPRQLSHLNGSTLSQLSGSRDGRLLTAVRTQSSTQVYVGDWEFNPSPKIINQRRLTLERSDSYPHAWSPDSQSVIFESNRNGRLEIFRQKLTRKGAALLASTPGDVYMPAVTPDGKWLLMTYRDRLMPGQPDQPSRHRLLRAPINGGPAVEVPLGEPLDEFRCSLPGRGVGCVLRTTEGEWQHYFELDPIHGKGRELGRTTYKATGLGRWALSPNGRQVILPDDRCAGCFLEIGLSAVPSQRSESRRHIAGIGVIEGMIFASSDNGWLAQSNPPGLAINTVFRQPFQYDASRTKGMYYVDGQLKAHLMYESRLNTSGVLSPDQKHIALLGEEMDSNVWSFERFRAFK